MMSYLHCKVAIRVSPVKQPTGLVARLLSFSATCITVCTYIHLQRSRRIFWESRICPKYIAKFWQDIKTLNIS